MIYLRNSVDLSEMKYGRITNSLRAQAESWRKNDGGFPDIKPLTDGNCQTQPSARLRYPRRYMLQHGANVGARELSDTRGQP